MAVCAVSNDVTWNSDPKSGVAGFVSHQNLSNTLLMIGTSSLSWIGYLGALKFLPPITISATMAIRPIITTFAAHIVFHLGMGNQAPSSSNGKNLKKNQNSKKEKCLCANFFSDYT